MLAEPRSGTAGPRRAGLSGTAPAGGDPVPTDRVLVVWLLAGLALLALLTLHPAVDPDLFARVAVGRLVEMSGGVVKQDPFAFTPRLDQWVDHEWLAGVVFYRVARWGGDAALLALALTMMGTTVGLLVRAQEELGRASAAWSLLTLVPAVGIWISVVRSRTFTFLFVAILLLVLVRWHNGRRGWIWLLPPCFVLWANLHGGFVAGLGLLGVSALAVSVRERRRASPLWLCLGACVLATLVNPFGLDYWTYILAATTRERPMILEWQTMRGWQIGIVVVLLLTFVGGAWRSGEGRRPPAEAWAMAGVSLWAAIDSQRLLNFLLVVLCVYGAGPYRAVVGGLVGPLSQPWRVALRRVSAAGALLAMAGLAVVSGRNLHRFAGTGLSYEAFPVGAVEWLERRGPGGRVLTHFNHGSFALWRLYPRYRVALDGRYEETYPDETVDMAALALQPRLPGHDEALADVDPDFIVVPEREWADAFGDGWEVIYEDSAAVLIARPGRVGEPAARPVRPMWTPGF
ncbi:MAG: hypothetical protein PVI57_01990 [Gemmatimonadota bacterium]